MPIVDSCWHTLGVDAAQADLVALKRAYALKLRVTRPDDDAGAYQRLREAYDRAQAELRWRREREAMSSGDPADVDEAPVSTHVGPATSAAPVAAADPPVMAALPPGEVAVHAPGSQPDVQPQPGEPEASLSWIDPGELARELLAHWKERGDEALFAVWPALMHHLDQIPLALRGESNRWFAELVLQNQDLPPDFIARLAQHFGWGQDFRVEQMLGYERAERLRELLAQDHIVPIRDPAVLAQYADLFVLRKLLAGSSGGWRGSLLALGFAALAHPALALRARATPARMLRALGVDLTEQPRIGETLQRASWLRAVLLALLLSAMPTTAGPHDLPWWLRAGLLAVVGAVGFGALLIANHFVGALQGPDRADQRWRRWFDRHRDAPWLIGGGVAAFGLAWIAVAVGRLQLGEDWLYLQPGLPIAWAVLMGLGVLALWPRGRPWEHLVLPVACLAGIAWTRMLAGSGGAFAGAAAAGVWLGLSQVLLVLRGDVVLAAYRNPWRLLRPRVWWGWLLYAVAIKAVAGFVLVVLVLSLPLTFMVIATVYGFGLPLAAIAASASVAWAGHLPSEQLAFMLPLAAGIALGLMALQALGTRLSRVGWFRRD